MHKPEREFVDAVAAGLGGLQQSLYELAMGNGVYQALRCINRQESDFYSKQWDATLAEVKTLPVEGAAELHARLESALNDLRVVEDRRELAFGMTIGLLLAGESPDAVRARLRTFDLYPE